MFFFHNAIENISLHDFLSQPKLVESLLNPTDISQLKQVKYGIQSEPVAIAVFERKHGIKTEKCGLFVHKDQPYLAASPDRIVQFQNITYVIEVKCPFTSQNKDISPDNVKYLKRNENGEIFLD